MAKIVTIGSTHIICQELPAYCRVVRFPWDGYISEDGLLPASCAIQLAVVNTYGTRPNLKGEGEKKKRDRKMRTVQYIPSLLALAGVGLSQTQDCFSRYARRPRLPAGTDGKQCVPRHLPDTVIKKSDIPRRMLTGRKMIASPR